MASKLEATQDLNAPDQIQRKFLALSKAAPQQKMIIPEIKLTFELIFSTFIRKKVASRPDSKKMTL